MPYRRLPNTDAARLKAIKKAIDMKMKTSSSELAFSFLTAQKLQTLLPKFETSLLRRKESNTNHIKLNREFSKLKVKARLYLSHYIQVMNFMILRGELPKTDRNFFGIESLDKSLPPLINNDDLLKIGKIIIEGDIKRQQSGGKIITNPTAAVVRVHFENFEDAYFRYNNNKRIHLFTQQKTYEFRIEADELILQLWNEIEESFVQLSDDEKRTKASEYGVAYVYRKSEKQNIVQTKLSNERANILKQTEPQKSEELVYESNYHAHTA